MKFNSPLSTWKHSLSQLSDESLLTATRACATSERVQTAWLVAHLAEVYHRNLALQRGYPSAFKYARAELGLTDAMAYERIAAAQLALELPEVVERIASGELSLAAAGELWRTLQEERRSKPVAKMNAAPLQPAFAIAAPDGEAALIIAATAASNRAPDSSEAAGSEVAEGPIHANPAPSTLPSTADKKQLLQVILGKTRREAEGALREWKQERRGTPEAPRPRPASTRTRHSPEWTELTLYLGPEELEKLDRLRDLLSHRLGSRDPHAVVGWLLEAGLDKVDPIRQEERATKRAEARTKKTAEAAAAKEGAPSARKPEVRHLATDSHSAAPQRPHHDARAPMTARTRKPIPARLKRRIWARDRGACQYRDKTTGHICGSTAFLDIDHILEVRNGGANSEENLRLACRAHNRRRHLWDAHGLTGKDASSHRSTDD